MVPADENVDDIKFLLVDDLEENVVALEALLRRSGLQLFKARSGTEALELLLQHEFALALLDVQMPGMDGFELAEIMRGTGRTRNVPIIFLTAVAGDENRRFQGYEAGAVDYLLKPLDSQMLTSKTSVFFELARQRQKIARQRDQLQKTAQELSGALSLLEAHSDNSPLAVVQLDPELRLTAWSKGAERMFGWTAAEMVGKAISELRWLHEDELGSLVGMADRLKGDGSPRDVQTHRMYRKDGTVLECEWYRSALLDGDGNLASLNAQILDVTKRRQAEDTQRLLIGELNHRVKNMLASVQAIAGQTLRHSASPEDFSDNFMGRINSLASVHTTLSNTTWQGAQLADLVRDQLRLGAVDETRVTTSGADLFVQAQLALHLSLVLHELGTNAIKYGALSGSEGRVSIDWSAAAGHLRLNWREHDGPTVMAPSRRGFGSILIERSIKAEGGEAVVSHASTGIVWKISVPLPEAHRTQDQAPGVGKPKRLEAGATPLPGAAGRHEALSGRRILVVEDEPLLALQLVMQLEDAGAEVFGPAASPEGAMEIIARAQLDGALLDGNLRGRPVDGVAAALADRGVPFVFISGYGRESLTRGFNSAPLLSKPFSIEDLLSAAARMIRPPVAPPAGSSPAVLRPNVAMSAKTRA